MLTVSFKILQLIFLFTANHKAVITIKHNTYDLSNSLHITRIRMDIDWNWKEDCWID